MGNWTFLYKRIERTKDEAIAIALSNINAARLLYTQNINKQSNYQSVIDNEEELYLNEYQQAIKDGLWFAIDEYQEDGVYHFSTLNLWYSLVSDVCRFFNSSKIYPIFMFSREECFNLLYNSPDIWLEIDKSENYEHAKNMIYNELNEFWDKYPDGMIRMS